jgi:hypothetical protein
MKKTIKDLIEDINTLELGIKQQIIDHAEDLQRSPDVLNSLRFQLDEWKELVNPVTKGSKLDRKSRVQDAHTVAFNIYNQVQYHWDLLKR